MTNYRVRDFDFEFDVRDLLEYESPRSSPYITPLIRKAGFVVIDGFEAGKSITPPDKFENILLRIAHLLVTSQQLNMPMTEVTVMGYPDAPGTDQTTMNLAFKRADDVRTKLKAKMTGLDPVSAEKVKFNVYVNNATGANYRQAVEVYLPSTCQAFWADYDLQSLQGPGSDVLGIDANPNIIKKDRKDAINLIGPEVEFRNWDRAKLALKGIVKDPLPVPKSDKKRYDAMKHLSDMQLNLFRKWHPGTTYGFDQGSLTKCFQTFSNGQLRSPNSAFPSNAIGEPDTSHYFLFAEFGFMAADSGLDTPAWTAALRALVGSQEVFMHVYRVSPKATPPKLDETLPDPSAEKPAVATHPLNTFKAKNFRPVGDGATNRGLGQSDATRLTAVAEKYSTMDLTHLRENAKLNLLRAQTLT